MKKRLALFLLALSIAHSSPSFAAWLSNGTPLCTAVQDQFRFAIVSDGAGGAIVAWDDYRDGTQYDIYCQRVNGSGTALWTANGVALCSASGDQLYPTIVSDGAGGAIVAWRDARTGVNQDGVYVRRIDAAGTPQWTPDGVALCTTDNAQTDLVSVSDGAGGAIIAWLDQGLGSIFARRVNASGTPQWTSDGVQVTFHVSTAPRISTDGAGGAIVTWEDFFNEGTTSDVYAQRLDAGGAVQWTEGGVAVCTQSGYQRWLAIVSDNSGGAVIAWEDERPGNLGVYAQRLNSAGTAQWTGDGVKVAGATFSEATAIASDGASGAFITWQDGSGVNYDIKARRIDAAGTPVGTGAVIVCNASFDQVTPSILSDGAGGAIIMWADNRNLNTSGTDIFAQRYNASSVRQWALNGVLVCNADLEQEVPLLAPDAGGGVIVAWRDRRDTLTNAYDLYAQRIGSGGLVPTAVRGATPSATLWVGNAYPNPFSSTTSFDLLLQSSSNVQIDIVDVAGRRVRTISLANVASGMRHINLDAHDDLGRRLPSGVYFYRVRAAGETATRKMVIAR